MKLFLSAAYLLAIPSLCFAQNWTEKKGAVNIVTNANGQTLGYVSSSAVQIITADGFAFKDLNKNGQLDIYEDWRQPAEARAKDLATKMTVAQIAGLMLYSAHQSIPAVPFGPMGPATYNGKAFAASGAAAADLSDQQKKFLQADNLRHVLITSVQSPEVAASWNNNAQAFAEGIGLGIPVNTSSDPRHGVVANAEYNIGAGGKISMWPDELGMAATFEPALVEKFGQIAAKEYRALGIATALSPQIDLGTEPRWSRIDGTFGEDPALSTDMARAYVDGFQTSIGKDEITNGWGYSSVNAMVKHWPGGGPEEAGRDAHFAYGKFAVYPGKNFSQHLLPFKEGAFKLSGKTKTAAAVMPYYTISYGQDTVNGENVGNGYSKYLITDLLRKKYQYDGVVCTDWMVTADEGKTPDIFLGKSWGVEHLSVAQRHYKALVAGVDQFGGNNEAGPVLEAYQMGVKELGEAAMRQRFEQSAVRLLLNIFRTGLFENPYLDPAKSKEVVGNAGFMKAGYEAQLKSIILLKNKAKVLPVTRHKTVYIPKRYTPAGKDWFGRPTPEKTDYPVNMEIVKKYYQVTDDPARADFAIVFIASPNTGTGYSREDVAQGGNGYVPISLQYGPYRAQDARRQSMAAGDPVEPGITNRSYYSKTVTAANISDLKALQHTREVLKGKPVIVAMTLNKPTIVAEFEKLADGIIASFGVQDNALLDMISGASEPSGLLPVQMPANMQTVERQREDVPHDMQPYRDENGHLYNFGYGLNWKGIINDARTKKYKH
jgi:beta-glucosidase